MQKLYSKIVIIKIDILADPNDPSHHQTTMHVQKEMSEADWKGIIVTMNFLQKIKNLVKDGVI